MKFATLINRELKLVLCVEKELCNDPTFGGYYTKESQYLYPIKDIVRHLGHVLNNQYIPMMFPTVKAASLFLNQVSEYPESFQDKASYQYLKADTLEVILLDDLEGVLDE